MICPIRIFKIPDDLPEVVDSPGLHVRRSKYVEDGARTSYIPEGIVGAGERSLIGPDYRPLLPWSIDDCTAVHVVHRGRNRADCAWAVDRSRSVRIRLGDGIGVRDRGVVNVVVHGLVKNLFAPVRAGLPYQELVQSLTTRPQTIRQRREIPYRYRWRRCGGRCFCNPDVVWDWGCHGEVVLGRFWVAVHACEVVTASVCRRVQLGIPSAQEGLHRRSGGGLLGRGA